jgi:hypothetical protein
MFQKILDSLIIKNTKTGRPSYTLTMALTGFFIINLKLLLSGVEIMDKVKMSEFSGVDYAAALAAIGSIHIFNKKVTKDNGDKDA